MSEELLLKKLDEIRSLTLLANKEMLTVEDLSVLTGFKASYIRKMACEGRLPYYKPFGKQLFFKKSEINQLLQGNRVPTVAELINQENEEHYHRRIPHHLYHRNHGDGSDAL